MKIIWLGHAAFRIEIEQAVLLIDPWLSGGPDFPVANPLFPADRRAEAIAGATHILLTHGHADHIGDSVSIASQLGIPIVAIADLADWMSSVEGQQVIDMNKGGTVTLGGARVTMVQAAHSSSFMRDGRVVYAGAEAGYMIAGEGHTLYLSGDTDIMADMEWMGDLHKPDIGILNCGGHYTMDMERAAYAARRYFNFKTVIPSHWRTFPVLAQSAEPLRQGLPGVQVLTPQVMEAVAI